MRKQIVDAKVTGTILVLTGTSSPYATKEDAQKQREENAAEFRTIKESMTSNQTALDILQQNMTVMLRRTEQIFAATYNPSITSPPHKSRATDPSPADSYMSKWKELAKVKTSDRDDKAPLDTTNVIQHDHRLYQWIGNNLNTINDESFTICFANIHGLRTKGLPLCCSLHDLTASLTSHSILVFGMSEHQIDMIHILSRLFTVSQTSNDRLCI